MKRTIFDSEHDAFRETCKAFYAKEVTPNNEQWEKEEERREAAASHPGDG